MKGKPAYHITTYKVSNLLINAKELQQQLHLIEELIFVYKQIDTKHVKSMHTMSVKMIF